MRKILCNTAAVSCFFIHLNHTYKGATSVMMFFIRRQKLFPFRAVCNNTVVSVHLNTEVARQPTG